MHMVPVAVLPEPSEEEESIMGVRVSDVGGGMIPFPILQRCLRKYEQCE